MKTRNTRRHFTEPICLSNIFENIVALSNEWNETMGGKNLFSPKKRKKKENSLDFIRSKANSGRIFTIDGNARFVYLILQLSQRCSRLRSIVKFREAGFKTHGYKDTWLAFLFSSFFFSPPSLSSTYIPCYVEIDICMELGQLYYRRK